ncbi:MULTISPECIES: hypothetical protein [unclassified Pseudomonas]|uniref:hypothetical protein n=1 Tax=unclassified Pseudomonas TaxID=196821 RepID=UPI001113F298|nr:MULTISPECIES: hypothetical protein [unclassified Pseudomonas]
MTFLRLVPKQPWRMPRLSPANPAASRRGCCKEWNRTSANSAAASEGNEVDTKREPQTWNTPSGDMLLALPTWYLVSGELMRTIEILLFNPHDLSNTGDKRWRYLTPLEADFNRRKLRP